MNVPGLVLDSSSAVTDPLPGVYRLGVSSTQSIVWERSPQMGGTVFTINSTRIVGLIAVVCAVVVAPQALAAQSTHSRIPPDDLSAPNNMHFAAGQLKSVKAATKAKAKAAAIAALRRRSVDLEAAYRKLHPDAYRPAVQKSDKAAVWSFPVFCNGQAQAEYDSGC
jgi:hypothetical protein